MSNIARRLNTAAARFGTRQKQKQQQPRGGIKGYSKYAADSELDEKHLKVVAVKLSAHPLALDMLVFILKTLIEKQKGSRNIDKKFTEVKTTTARYKSTIALADEWGEELLKLAGFYKTGDIFKISHIDSARLWLTKSFLEEERKSDTYKMAKRKVDFQKIIDKAIKDDSPEERARRAEMALRVAPPPHEGAAGSTRIYVFLGTKIVQRFFAHDDRLDEVFMWIGALYSSTIPEKLQEGEYELINRSFYPGQIMDVDRDMKRTLFDLDLSPSGELHVLPVGMFEDEREMHGVKE